MADKTLWEELSEPVLPGIGELFDWAMNYEREDSPWLLFLDVIGWSDEHIGERLTERTYLDGYGMEYFTAAMNELLRHGEKAWRYIDELERLALEANA